MTKIKMCGLRREADIEYVNKLMPDYIGYVFAQKSKRYVSPETAAELTKILDKKIISVGVFVNEPSDNVIALVREGVIRVVQLHGNEDEKYISRLQKENITVIKAFIIRNYDDIKNAVNSSADFILLDSGSGSGEVFDHKLLKNIGKRYFLAGGLNPENVETAVKTLDPYAVDVSSGIETDGFKDFEKMQNFSDAVRKCGL